jgi:hypothetical protein
MTCTMLASGPHTSTARRAPSGDHVGLPALSAADEPLLGLVEPGQQPDRRAATS